MFADDTLLFNSDQPSSVHQPVCESLSQMVDWCKKWLLKLKATKCKCMRITRSRSVTPCSYNINSISLEQVKTHKHLGVIISSDLSWKPHVLSVAAKANRILGLLKRTFGKCSEAITIGYKSIVSQLLSTLVLCGIHINNICLISLKECKGMLPGGSLVVLSTIVNVWSILAGQHSTRVVNFLV